MFSKQFDTRCKSILGFYADNIVSSFDQLTKLALQASQDKNVYGLAQCLFEQYLKCKHMWFNLEFDSESYIAKETFTYSEVPSIVQDGLALYFLRSLESHSEFLNSLLNQVNAEFFDEFYKKYSKNEKSEINSFFNLVNYTSNNIKVLKTGFNNVATMAIVHNKSVRENNNADNVYTKNALALNLF